jgi:hypothetical protein
MKIRLPLVFGSLLIHGAALASLIPIPNGDFSDPNNDGSVGGGAIGGSGSNVTIGAGPWTGSYSGVAGLLSPPTLTIGSGSGTISGLAGAGVVTTVDNSALFFQTLAVGFSANTTYTLTADITTSQTLTLTLLTTANAGIAITGASGTLASTATSSPSQIGLTPLTSTTTQVTLQYTTGAVAPAGNIGIELFALPNGVLNGDLLHTVSFDNVTLDASVPESNATGGASWVLCALVVAVHHLCRRKCRIGEVSTL